MHKNTKKLIANWVAPTFLAIGLSTMSYFINKNSINNPPYINIDSLTNNYIQYNTYNLNNESILEDNNSPIKILSNQYNLLTKAILSLIGTISFTIASIYQFIPSVYNNQTPLRHKVLVDGCFSIFGFTQNSITYLSLSCLRLISSIISLIQNNSLIKKTKLYLSTTNNTTLSKNDPLHTSDDSLKTLRKKTWKIKNIDILSSALIGLSILAASLISFFKIENSQSIIQRIVPSMPDQVIQITQVLFTSFAVVFSCMIPLKNTVTSIKNFHSNYKTKTEVNMKNISSYLLGSSAYLGFSLVSNSPVLLIGCITRFTLSLIDFVLSIFIKIKNRNYTKVLQNDPENQTMKNDTDELNSDNNQLNTHDSDQHQEEEIHVSNIQIDKTNTANNITATNTPTDKTTIQNDAAQPASTLTQTHSPNPFNSSMSISHT